LGEDIKTVDLKQLKALQPRAGAAPKDDKKAAAPASAPTAKDQAASSSEPARVRPGFEKAYNSENWESKRHARKNFVNIYKRFQEWRDGATLYDRFAERFLPDEEDPEPLIEYTVREDNLVNSHYWPLRGERGAHAILPGFRENRYTHEICQEFAEEIYGWCLPNKSDGRKCSMMMLLIFICFFSAWVVWINTDGWCLFGFICH